MSTKRVTVHVLGHAVELMHRMGYSDLPVRVAVDADGQPVELVVDAPDEDGGTTRFTLDMVGLPELMRRLTAHERPE